jgi:hypothetical protein
MDKRNETSKGDRPRRSNHRGSAAAPLNSPEPRFIGMVGGVGILEDDMLEEVPELGGKQACRNADARPEAPTNRTEHADRPQGYCRIHRLLTRKPSRTPLRRSRSAADTTYVRSANWRTPTRTIASKVFGKVNGTLRNNLKGAAKELGRSRGVDFEALDPTEGIKALAKSVKEQPYYAGRQSLDTAKKGGASYQGIAADAGHARG